MPRHAPRADGDARRVERVVRPAARTSARPRRRAAEDHRRCLPLTRSPARPVRLCLVEDDDAAGHFCGLHGGERALDVCQTDPSRHQSVDIQSATQREVDERRQVAVGIGRPEDTAANLLRVCHQRQRRDAHLVVEAPGANNGDDAAAAGGVVRRSNRR